jgi:hypothetical protein
MQELCTMPAHGRHPANRHPLAKACSAPPHSLNALTIKGDEAIYETKGRTPLGQDVFYQLKHGRF